MAHRERLSTLAATYLGSWRLRDSLGRTRRYRVAERRALRTALARSSVVVAAVLMAGALFTSFTDPLVGPELLILNFAGAAVSLGLAWLAQGRARRHVVLLAATWGFLMAGNLLLAGLTSPLQLRTAVLIMPSIPLVYALFIPWPVRVHLVAVGWTTLAGLLLTFLVAGSGIDPMSPIALTAVLTGGISVVGHAHRRAERIAAFEKETQIRGFHRRANEAGRRLHDANRAISSRARLDPLTGAGNRLGLEEALAVLDAGGDGAPTSVAFVLLDLDRFKPYNDRNGHLAGDWVLRRVTDTMAESVRANDSVYRFGGEEILVLLEEVDEAATEVVVGRILTSIEAMAVPHPENRPWQVVTVSAGWVLHVPGGALTTTASLAAADEALYRAKRLGRNRAVAAGRPDRESVPA